MAANIIYLKHLVIMQVFILDTRYIDFDNVVLVTDDEKEMQDTFIKDFTSAVLTDSVTNVYAREKGSLIIIFKGGNNTFKKYFINKIEKDKDKVRWQ